MTPLTVLDKVVEALQAAGATEEMIAAAVGAAGEFGDSPPRPNGRPRKYADRALRDRAYRERKKARDEMRDETPPRDEIRDEIQAPRDEMRDVIPVGRPPDETNDVTLSPIFPTRRKKSAISTRA